MIAITYSRYSSSNQREESISAQQRAMSEHAHRSGYTIVREFTDSAKSATTDDRPGFLEMIRLLSSGRLKADVVLVHKLDRFARNRYDAAYYRHEIRKAGARLESVLEPLDDSPESVLLESLIEGMAEYFSKSLGREVMKGMHETALQGKHNGGRPPLGYALDKDRRYIIDPRGAEAVKLIFTRFAAGANYGEIIEELNTKGYLTIEGQPFRKTSLISILRNKKYTGVYIFNRAVSKSMKGTRNNSASKPKEEIIEIPGGMPVIIEPEIWDAAQERMKGRKKHGGGHRAKTVYLLSGLCFCGKCGRSVVGSAQSYQTRVSKEHRERNIYVCTGARLHGEEKCRLPRYPKEVLEKAVMDVIRQQLFTDEVLTELATHAADFARRRNEETKEEGKRIEGELKKINGRIRNIVDTVATLGTSAPTSLIDELRTLESARADAEARLAHWERAQQATPDTDRVLSYLKERRAQFDTDDPRAQQRIIQEFVTRVIVDDNKAKIHLVIKDDGGYEWWRRAVTIAIHHQPGRSRPKGKTPCLVRSRGSSWEMVWPEDRHLSAAGSI
jgi:site-specific DNA recombinase